MGWGILRYAYSQPAHIANASSRKRQAEERLRAAEQDREAALLEAVSEKLEDEASAIRTGKMEVPLRRK
jgi:hypothetical protein